MYRLHTEEVSASLPGDFASQEVHKLQAHDCQPVPHIGDADPESPFLFTWCESEPTKTHVGPYCG